MKSQIARGHPEEKEGEEKAESDDDLFGVSMKAVLVYVISMNTY